MARAKPSRDPVLQSWQEVDESLRRIGEITAVLDKANAGMNERIQRLREEAEAKYMEVAKEKLRLEKDIEEFTLSRRDEFKEKKSKALVYGTVSFRINPYLYVRSIELTVKLIKQKFGKNATEYLHVKEQPNKEKMESWSDEEVKEVGIIRKRPDEFGYTLNWENLEEALKQKTETAASK